jgi:hypothetical protein
MVLFIATAVRTKIQYGILSSSIETYGKIEVYTLCENWSISYPKFGIRLEERYQSNIGNKETYYLKFYCAVKRKLDNMIRHDTTRHVAKRTGMNSIQAEYILVTFFHINKVEQNTK